jgi:DNA repair photolyase
MTKSLEVLQREIKEENREWVESNTQVKAAPGYSSPRISSEIMDCSMPMTFDQYSYCSLGCQYCFAYFFKSNNPAMAEMQLKSVDTSAMAKAIQGNPPGSRWQLLYDNFLQHKFVLHWGGLADPFCNFERTNRAGKPLIEALASENYPCLFSFKGTAYREYMPIWKGAAQQKNFAFQISIVSPSDEMSKKIEIGVPPTSIRLRAIERLSGLGYWTILRLRPFIHGITDDGLLGLLERARDAGISAISTEYFALDARSNEGMKKRYEWISHLVGVKGGSQGLIKYFSALSPHERGGYMRLNRQVKENSIKLMYRFCVENGIVFSCSDPDFKELNMSGSCCGMPAHYPENPGLENWTKSQLTYHLKECRRKYHLTGEDQYLHFGTTFGKEKYLDDWRFAQDHVGVIGRCNAERQNMSQRAFLQEHWNNLRSPANPRNYFHGKLAPVGLDGDGNFIFKYMPMEYEKEWIKEGIDLTK